MRSLFVFILFSFFSYDLFSQNKVFLSGSVKDVNKESLVGINIYLTNNKNVGTISDYEGNYSLEVSGELPIQLTFSGIGYETTYITIDEYGAINEDIILNESVLFGDEVIVSASLFEQNILTSPVSQYFCEWRDKLFYFDSLLQLILLYDYFLMFLLIQSYITI